MQLVSRAVVLIWVCLVATILAHASHHEAHQRLVKEDVQEEVQDVQDFQGVQDVPDVPDVPVADAPDVPDVTDVPVADVPDVPDVPDVSIPDAADVAEDVLASALEIRDGLTSMVDSVLSTATAPLMHTNDAVLTEAPEPPIDIKTTSCITTITFNSTRGPTKTIYLGKTTTSVSRVSCAPGCGITSRMRLVASPRTAVATVSTSADRTVTAFACITASLALLNKGGPVQMPKIS